MLVSYIKTTYNEAQEIDRGNIIKALSISGKSRMRCAIVLQQRDCRQVKRIYFMYRTQCELSFIFESRDDCEDPDGSSEDGGRIC